MSRGRRATGRQGLNGYDRSSDVTPQARQARRFSDKDAAAYMPVLHTGGCWCGGTSGHDWPGKDAGEPHPRDWPEPAASP
jgi:hypothetical protein